MIHFHAGAAERNAGSITFPTGSTCSGSTINPCTAHSSRGSRACLSKRSSQSERSIFYSPLSLNSKLAQRQTFQYTSHPFANTNGSKSNASTVTLKLLSDEIPQSGVHVNARQGSSLRDANRSSQGQEQISRQQRCDLLLLFRRV